MTQAAYANKPRESPYRKGQIQSPHYYGPPALRGEKAEALPREAKGPAPYMTGRKAATDNKKYGGKWKAAYPDKGNNHPDHPLDFHDWGATPECFEGWRRAGTKVIPANYDPVSRGIEEDATITVGEPHIMDSGDGFTKVTLYTSPLTYKGRISNIGVALSRKRGPIVSMYGNPVMKRWVTPLPKAANGDLEQRLNAA